MSPEVTADDRLPANFPAYHTSFTGRARELEIIVELLGDPTVRWITLTGPEGVGKTRTAVRAVRAYHPDHAPVRSVFVPLATVRDPDQVLPMIARLLDPGDAGNDPAGVVVRAAWQHDLIVLLDNADAVTAAGPALAEMLTRPGCERVTLLVTSRGPFNLPGEHVLTLAPLPLVDASEERADVIRASDAVELFIARARAARADLHFNDREVRDIAALCRRLDGLPLAIELTASRLRQLTLSAVTAKLEASRFSLDPPATPNGQSGQRALRDTIAISYELLSPAHRQLFRRLSVFAGGISVESARRMAAGRPASTTTGYPFADGYRMRFPFEDFLHDPGPGEAAELSRRLPLAPLVLDAEEALEHLADRGLLQRVPGIGDEPRYEFLETIREFASEQLSAEDDPEPVHHTHAAIMLAVAEAASDGTWVPARRVLGIEHIDIELANLRVALDWLISAGEAAVDLTLRLIDVLTVYWQMRGMAAEGALWLNRILAIEGGSTFRRANALNSLGYLHELLGNTEQAERALQQALALLDDSAYSSPRGRACFFLALVAWRNGPAYIHDAHRFLIDALESFARWNDALGQGLSKLALGEFARRAGQLPESLHCFADAYALHHAVGYEWGMATARWFTGEAHRAAGDEREAAAAFADALQVYSGFGDRLGASGCLGGIACLLTGRREWTAAGRLFGAAAARKERTQSFLLPTHEAEYGAIAQTVILAGGTAAFAAGQHLSQEQAIAEALGLANAIATGQPIDVDRGGTKKGLTRTQKQVLVHFGEGHEPKTIAGMLGKSPKTIYDHLKHLCAHFDCASYDELRQRTRHLGLRNEAIDPLSHP